MVSGWVRWILPSVVDLIFLALLGGMSVGVFAPRLLGDAGIGWHVGSSRVDLQACKLEYSIVSPK